MDVFILVSTTSHFANQTTYMQAILVKFAHLCTLNNLAKGNKSNITHSPCGVGAKGLYKSNKCELKRKIVAKILAFFWHSFLFSFLPAV